LSDSPAHGSRLSLIGLRCSGKTSVGRALAPLAGASFCDLDEDLLAQAQPGERAGSAGELLARIGESSFRTLEAAALEQVLQRPGPLVVATGGGSVCLPGNRELLRERTFCVWLDAPVPVLADRLRKDVAFRPPLLRGDSAAELEELSRLREALYAETAAARIDASAGTVEELARCVLGLWKPRRMPGIPRPA
jgi:shikimate kinase